jgi:hypothetical protein
MYPTVLAQLVNRDAALVDCLPELVRQRLPLLLCHREYPRPLLIDT